MRDCTMAVTGAVTVSGAVSPKLSRLASRASHPRGAPLADLHAVRRAFAGPPRVRFRRSRARCSLCAARASMRKGRARLQLPARPAR